LQCEDVFTLLTLAVRTNQEVNEQPIQFSQRFLLDPLPNAWQQDLVPEIRNGLLQVVNISCSDLDHRIICSSGIIASSVRDALDIDTRVLLPRRAVAGPLQRETVAVAIRSEVHKSLPISCAWRGTQIYQPQCARPADKDTQDADAGGDSLTGDCR
jgi:hypothetical protein